ncbi:DNA-binding response regulator [Bacteroidota bacterium]|nr:DNA-binding response regulator [Bacteroidota bacterium]
MNNIKAILIDDEVNCTDILSIQLKKHCSNVEVIAVCNSAKDGIEKINELNPDVIFLDIEMPHMNGFRLLEQLTPFNFEVVFTTAYDEFAIKAFKVCATDYLLKPIDKTELIEAVRKVATKKNGNNNSSTQMTELLKMISSQSQEKKIALPTNDGMLFLKPSDIIRCESDSNYTYVFLANGEKICVTKTLKQVEESLHGFSFFRVHQSHLVNLNHVIKYNRDDSGIITSDGTTITIARQRKEGFLEMFSKI